MGPHVGASLPSLLWSSPGPPTVPSGLLGNHSLEGQGPLKRRRGPVFCPERQAISLCQGCRGCWGVWIPTCPYSISACRGELEPRALSNEWLLGQDCTWALAGGWDYWRQSLSATQDAKSPWHAQITMEDPAAAQRTALGAGRVPLSPQPPLLLPCSKQTLEPLPRSGVDFGRFLGV